MFDLNKPILLCVDDDIDILELLSHWLSDRYNVLTATSGQQALQSLQRVKPDLILLDVMMPELDGYAVCGHLQQDPETAWIPVLFISALGEEQDKARAFAAGAVDYLVKPLDSKQVLALVDHHLKTGQRWQASRKLSGIRPQSEAGPSASFCHYFCEYFKLSPAQAQLVLAANPTAIYQVAKKLGIASTMVAKAIAEYKGCKYVDFINPDAIKLGALPAPFSRANNVVVLEKQRQDLLVLSNPFDMVLRDSLAAALSPELLDNVGITEPENFQHFFEQQPVPYVTDRLLAVASRERASDIHIEPSLEGEYIIRLRIDGTLEEWQRLGRDTGSRVISRFKVLGGMDISERRRSQDGAFTWPGHGQGLRLRLATAATAHGEGINIRLLDAGARAMSLDELGMSPQQQQALRELAERSQGLVMVVGPTGSGKTTTVYSVLSGLDRSSHNLITVEDPIEYQIELANQQQVNSKAGITFDSLLRASVRQDPDILFVGEIRDPYSARIAVDFASTGRLTFTTLHTTNATTALFRLERLGVERSDLVSALTGIVAQRLLRKLCPHCRAVRPPSPEEKQLLEALGFTAPEQLADPVGCPRCNGMGYLGREGIYEVVVIDRVTAELIASATPIAAIRANLRQRGVTLLSEHAVQKMGNQVFSFADVYGKVLVEESPQAVAKGDGMAILLVDDDADHNRLLSHMLSEAGYNVTCAGDGIEALLALGKTGFDLILVDLDMPNLDGFKLLEMKVQKGIAAPVILVSSLSQQHLLQQAVELGAAGYVHKPVTKDRLLAKVQQVLKK